MTPWSKPRYLCPCFSRYLGVAMLSALASALSHLGSARSRTPHLWTATERQAHTRYHVEKLTLITAHLAERYASHTSKNSTSNPNMADTYTPGCPEDDPEGHVHPQR
uniref:Uncharacterized protein n=1 Tax=Branchiostoma floridae TaxID=7739 RepID=C3ZC28_BRAFL|eukprot:XP_002593789.1 hypothetical protein BRAFLDRAFT_75752 [Branchiostoma floridae]